MEDAPSNGLTGVVHLDLPSMPVMSPNTVVLYYRISVTIQL